MNSNCCKFTAADTGRENSFIRQASRMYLSSLKILGAIVSPLKWLYNLFGDQTKVEVNVPFAENLEWKSIPIQDQGLNTGLLMFSITTCSRHPVEVTQVEVHYRAPFQLFDPGSRGFFVGAGNFDTKFPFCLRWRGSVEVRHNLRQAFAVTARFPAHAPDQAIQILIHAHCLHSSIGGFHHQGRSHINKSDWTARLISWPPRGLVIPPKSILTTPQPFLIEGPMMGSTAPGESANLSVNTLNADGTASSTEIHLR